MIRILMSDWLREVLFPYAREIPLSWLSFIGSFIEELMPPIPAFPVMVMVGSFAKLQEYSLFGLFFLALLSAAGKVGGAFIIYKIVDRLEDVFAARFGSLFGLKPGQLESYGEKLGRNGADFISLVLLRATPLIPSTLVSVTAGLIKVRERVFLLATYLGTVIRDSLYLYVGYYGTLVLRHYVEEAKYWQLALTALLLIGAITTIIYLYIKKTNAQKPNELSRRRIKA